MLSGPRVHSITYVQVDAKALAVRMWGRALVNARIDVNHATYHAGR